MRVALFITCIADTLYPATGRATVEVLERLGHSVAFPAEQTCCGQMHLNSGFSAEAIRLLRRFVGIFEDEAYEAIVAPSASCVATVLHQYPRLARSAGDRHLAEAVDGIRARVWELSQFLVDGLGVEDVGAYFPHRVTYHPTCHSLRSLELADAPLRLLGAVRSIELVELPNGESCCGFGGTFALKNAETSIAMMSAKLRDIESVSPEVCVAADNSCLLHIGGGLSRRRAATRVLHLAEVLAAGGGETPESA